MIYVLYNPLADNGQCVERNNSLEKQLEGKNAKFLDITLIKITDFLDSVGRNDEVIISGGDGTINRLINDLGDYKLNNTIWYYPSGTGNDFIRDMSERVLNRMIKLNPYIEKLPTVEIKGARYRFINGIGYGLDGYCCEAAEWLRQRNSKKINYTAIAVKGVFFHYKPSDATVEIDGVKKSYKRVWIAPTMNGRYYGGGMKIAPEQDRENPAHSLTLMVFHNVGKLRALYIFSKVFKGRHRARKGSLDFLTGHDIRVSFDRPQTLQLDGETFTDVSYYHAAAYSEVGAAAGADK